MKVKKILTVAAVYCLGCFTILSGQDKSGSHLKYTAGIITGYNRGFGVQGNFTARNFEKDFPFQLRFGIGYTFLNPGNAADARRIFVNNATNGTPEKKGRSIDYRLDFMIPKTIFNIEDSYLVLGPRFSSFMGDFKYVGGNEDFEVKSHQFGIGVDLENHFHLIKNIELVLNYGLDFYFPSTMSGHDTSYSPDNDNVNPKNDNQNDNSLFNYKDADKAIRQPKFMPHVMIGVNFDL
ncbi:MAG: hypothetical protein IPN67_11955 [Bacteroidales bacterium]|nr:hypothetical protein [Bacteroidales bacterium]MBK8883063.1 hypothetical protein [Bacteroidales bacterium]